MRTLPAGAGEQSTAVGKHGIGIEIFTQHFPAHGDIVFFPVSGEFAHIGVIPGALPVIIGNIFIGTGRQQQFVDTFRICCPVCVEQRCFSFIVLTIGIHPGRQQHQHQIAIVGKYSFV